MRDYREIYTPFAAADHSGPCVCGLKQELDEHFISHFNELRFKRLEGGGERVGDSY